MNFTLFSSPPKVYVYHLKIIMWHVFQLIFSKYDFFLFCVGRFKSHMEGLLVYSSCLRKYGNKQWRTLSPCSCIKRVVTSYTSFSTESEQGVWVNHKPFTILNHENFVTTLSRFCYAFLTAQSILSWIKYSWSIIISRDKIQISYCGLLLVF